MFDKSLRIGVILSPKTLQKTLQGETLSQLPINRGLTLTADFNFPESCGSDKICKFCKEALGARASMRLRAVIESTSQFMIAAGVSNIRLSDNIELSSVELQVDVGTETSIGLAGELILTDPPITLHAALAFAPAEIQIKTAMLGTWERPFGIDYLAVRNLALETGITLTFPPVLSKLIGGGEVRIGKINSGKEVTAKVYFGMDLNTPQNNFFYGSISTVTISGILEAFEIQTSLPPVLSQTGFPHGLSASYSISETEVSGHVIPAGFKLNGTLNILGLVA